MFDSHAHYDDKQFDEDRDILLPELFKNGVEGIINIACDIETAKKSLAIAEKYEKVYTSIGIHPHEAANVPVGWYDVLKQMLDHKKVVAIGEIGLDYHYDFSPRDVQQKIFDAQMCLARETEKPIIIHDREAHGDTLSTVNRYPDVNGVLHSFSGSYEMAEALVKKGYYISFSGSVTFKNAEKLRHAVEAVPIDRVLCETDAPYLSPVPERGKRNHSIRMKHTLQMLAEIYKTDFETMSNACRDNAYRLFGI